MKKVIIGGIILIALITGCKSTTSNNPPPSKINGPTITTIKPTTSSPSPKPTHKATPVVIITESGSNENINSKPFNIGTSAITVTYSYSNCPYDNGNFIADLITAGVSQSDLNYEDINIANAIGSGANTTTNEYPQNPGTNYYLSIQTECNFTITIKGEG